MGSQKVHLVRELAWIHCRQGGLSKVPKFSGLPLWIALRGNPAESLASCKAPSLLTGLAPLPISIMCRRRRSGCGHLYNWPRQGFSEVTIDSNYDRKDCLSWGKGLSWWETKSGISWARRMRSRGQWASELWSVCSLTVWRTWQTVLKFSARIEPLNMGDRWRKRVRFRTEQRWDMYVDVWKPSCMTYDEHYTADTDRRKISSQDYKFASDGLRLFELKPGVSLV